MRADRAATEIAAMTPADWEAVRAVLVDGLRTGDASLEVEPETGAEWDAAHLRDGRLVARRAGRVVGWAALRPVSNRAVSRGVAEVSVYVAAAARRRGVGRALLEALVEASEAAGIWTLQASILAENRASIALHRTSGFRTVGTRERLGQRLGVWRDVVLMERRSAVVGRSG